MLPLGQHGRAAGALLALLVLAGCASTGARVTRGDGPSLVAAQAESALGGKYRIAVAPIIDKSGTGKRSITHQIERLSEDGNFAGHLTQDAITGGLHDMLVTELFQSDRFIVLERGDLDAVMVEQEFSQSTRAGEATRLPLGQLEGAELIVLGAITAFDPGISGAALPIPFKFGDNDIGILNVAYSRGRVVMDLRVVDARTGRVLSSVAVEGTNSRMGVDVDAYVFTNGWRIDLPSVMNAFKNTPVERALQEMVQLAVQHIAGRVPKPEAAAAAPADGKPAEEAAPPPD